MNPFCTDCQITLNNPVIDGEVAYFICPECFKCYEREHIKEAQDKDFCIKKFEKEYNKKLPDAYVKFIKDKDFSKNKRFEIKIKGEIPEKLKYYLGDGVLDISINDVDLYSHKSIFITQKMTKEWELPDDLVLLDGDGHTWIALDYRQNKSNPSVTFVETDNYNEFKLAQSFEELLTLQSEE